MDVKNCTSEELLCLVEHQVQQRIVAFEHALHCMSADAYITILVGTCGPFKQMTAAVNLLVLHA